MRRAHFGGVGAESAIACGAARVAAGLEADVDVAIVVRRECAPAPVCDSAAVIPIEAVKREGAAVRVLNVGHAFAEREIVRTGPLAALAFSTGDGDGRRAGAAWRVVPENLDAL